MKLTCILLLFPFLSSYAQESLEIETIFSKYVSYCKKTDRGAYVRYRKQVPLIEISAPKINVLNQKNKTLRYQLQGNLRSGGLTIQRVKSIRIENKIIADTLILKHFIQVKQIPGKEGANVMGYNYAKEEFLKIPKNISSIKIELYDEGLIRHTPSGPLETIRLLAETDVKVIF